VSDRVSVFLMALVGVAGVVFAVTVMDLSWPAALLLAGTPPVMLSLAMLAKSRNPDR